MAFQANFSVQSVTLSRKKTQSNIKRVLMPRCGVYEEAVGKVVGCPIWGVSCLGQG